MRRKNPVLVQIGKTIRRFRQNKGLSQEELSLVAELDRSYVGGVERGERNLSLLKLFRLAKALDVPASKFLEDVKEKE